MLTELTQTVFQLFHSLAAVAMLIGVLYLLMAIISGRGADAYVKAIAIIILAGYIGRLGGIEEAPPAHSRAHPASFTTAARVVPPRACRQSSLCDAPALRL
jgi:hypothetical protein